MKYDLIGDGFGRAVGQRIGEVLIINPINNGVRYIQDSLRKAGEEITFQVIHKVAHTVIVSWLLVIPTVGFISIGCEHLCLYSMKHLRTTQVPNVKWKVQGLRIMKYVLYFLTLLFAVTATVCLSLGGRNIVIYASHQNIFDLKQQTSLMSLAIFGTFSLLYQRKILKDFIKA